VTGSPPAPFDSHGPIPVALGLGWEMAGLYPGAEAKRQAPPPERDLPTWGDLEPWQQTHIALDHIRVALKRLTPTISESCLTIPDFTPVCKAFEKVADDEGLKTAIYDFHDEIFRCLHAVDLNLGKAYDLGRSLAYTCEKPVDAQSLRDQFRPGRLNTLKGWLADLASALPDHASRGVAISIGIWQEATPEPDEKRKRGQLTDDDVAKKHVIPQLHRQAKVWREMLVGEKDGHDMLRTQDYVAAASRLFTSATGLVASFIIRTYFVFPIILAGGGYGVWTILHSGGKTGTQIVGALAAADAALGISWKGTQATLGQIAVKLEQPLWNAEVDTAIGSAMTTLDHQRFASRPAKIANEVSPPYGPTKLDAPPKSSDAQSQGAQKPRQPRPPEVSTEA
jgi:hypothetical protein